MLSRKVHQIGLETIFKEPLYTAAEGGSPVCDLPNISVHVHLSEHTIKLVELLQPC